MPIKTQNKARYPENWKQISEDIRFNRANNRCEVCGVPNYAWVNSKTRELCLSGEDGAIRIILTVAHLDHQPENCDYLNLMAMCQKCHNNYDRQHRNRTIKSGKLIGQTEIQF